MASPTFQIQVRDNHGSGLAGQLVGFTVPQGSAELGPCNATVCSVATNSYGQAEVTVTPTAIGPLTIAATDGALTQSASLMATTGVDLLTISTAPSATQPYGATPTLQTLLTLPDGVTGVNNVPVIFSGPPGVTFQACGGNPCAVNTGYQGLAATRIRASEPGTFTVTVTYGTLAVSISLQFLPQAPAAQWKVISAPSGNIPVGTTAATAFQAQLLDGNGHPVAGKLVTMGAALDNVRIAACGNGSCEIPTDGNGMVSSKVTPTAVGAMVVEVVYLTLVAQANFTSVGPGASLTVVTPPPANVATGSTVSFKLLGLGADGVTPLAKAIAWVSLTSGDLGIAGCPLSFCKYYLKADGTLTISGIPWTPGLTTVNVAVGELAQNVSFMAVAPVESMKVISAPSGSYAAGAAIAPAFAVQVLKADGVTGVSGENVAFAVSSGSASFAACPAVPCVIKTNATGLASTGAIGNSGAGAVTLTATDHPSSGSLSATASYSVQPKPVPDIVTVASAPMSVFLGATTTTPFTVKVTLGDGTTAAGVAVTLTATGAGSALLQACGASSCTLTTNASGLVSSTLTGTQVGKVILQGTAQLALGNQTVSGGVTVLANVRLATASPGQSYVAAGATIALPLEVTLVQDGTAAIGQAVVWNGSGTVPGGFSLGALSGVTDGFGNATAQAMLGPLVAGASASATGCGWGTVCGQFSGTGVSAAIWEIAVVSGGNQIATGGEALAAVVAQVTDGAGHPLAGATVVVGQTVRAQDGTCPVEGRCPAAPTLATGSSSLVSDGNGDVSVQPLVVSGTATTTSLAFSTGLRGFATAVASSAP